MLFQRDKPAADCPFLLKWKQSGEKKLRSMEPVPCNDNAKGITNRPKHSHDKTRVITEIHVDGQIYFFRPIMSDIYAVEKNTKANGVLSLICQIPIML